MKIATSYTRNPFLPFACLLAVLTLLAAGLFASQPASAQDGGHKGCCRLDINSDGKGDVLVLNPRLRVGQMAVRPLGPGLGSMIVVGTKRLGGGVAGYQVYSEDIDGDGEKEIILVDPAQPNGGRVRTQDVDGDGDVDIVWID